jgi:hypothetical protein
MFFYIISGIPSIGVASSGISTSTHLLVSNTSAAEATFSNAVRLTMIISAEYFDR